MLAVTSERRIDVVERQLHHFRLRFVQHAGSDIQRDEAERVVDLVEAQPEDGGDTHRPDTGRHAGERIERARRRQQVDAVADAHAELLRQILAKHDAVVVFIVARPEIGQLPGHDRLLDFGHRALELGVDAFEVDEGIGARGRRHGATQKSGRDADDVRNLAQRLDLGAVVLDAGGLEDVGMGRRAQDAIAQLALQPGHHRHRDDQRKDADGHAQRGHDGNDGDERLPPSAEQVTQRDLKFKRHDRGQTLF